MSELFRAVDDLLADPADLPPPAARARLRKAAGRTQLQVATALGVTELTVLRWENDHSSPLGERRQVYARLLRAWARRYPEAVPAECSKIGR